MAEWAQRGRPAVPSDNNSNDGYNNPAVFYDELDSSDNESIGDGKQKSKKRVPKCARCKNHGIPAKVKDHKDVCPQRFCLCNKCIATSVRQREMKKQTAIRRKLVRYKKLTEKQKKISELKKLPMPRLNVSDEVIPAELPPSNNPSHMANNKSSTSNAVVEQPLANAPVAQNSSPMVLNLSAPEPEDTLKTNMNECNLTETEQTEILLGFSSRLMKRFGYSSEALSLIYVILKDTKKDVELAMKRIIEANNEIQETTLYKILKAGISYYYTNGPPVGHAVDNLGKPTYFGRVPYFGAGDSDLFHNPELSAKPLDSSDSPPKRPSSDPGVISPAAPASLGFFPYALGTPVMSAKVPTSPANPLQKSSSYPGMASPPTTAGLGIFPYSLGTYVTAAKVPARPSSPRERPSSYPGMASPPATTAGLGIFPYPLASYAATAKAPQPPTSPSSPRERPVPPYLGMESPVTTTGLSFLPPYALGAPVMATKVSTSNNPTSQLEVESSSYQPGMASSPTSAGLFPYTLGTYVAPAKVPPTSNPASPRERPSSYPGMASPPIAVLTTSRGFAPYALGTRVTATRVQSSSPVSPRDTSSSYTTDMSMGHRFKVERSDSTD